MVREIVHLDVSELALGQFDSFVAQETLPSLEEGMVGYTTLQPEPATSLVRSEGYWTDVHPGITQVDSWFCRSFHP